jgi:VWFA-related protein
MQGGTLLVLQRAQLAGRSAPIMQITSHEGVEPMSINARLGCFFLATLLCAGGARAQLNSAPAPAADGKIHLEVVVTPRSGPPVGDLQQQDFTIVDNKTPRTITSFQVVTGREAPIRVVLVIDAINTTFTRISIEREEISKFLRAEGGHLAYPIALAVFTDKGMQIVQNFSSDGNVLAGALDKEEIGLRDMGRSAGYNGAIERWQHSVQALQQLVAGEAALPGRKIMLWVSPGWPIASGASAEYDTKQQKQLFANIVSLSTQLRQARITIYNIDPLGTSESLTRETYYKEFLKGISKPSQVTMGNLALQVLAVQSGGLVLSSANDVASLLQQCLTDSAPYYEISFDPSTGAKPDEYHHLEIKVAKPDLTARTRQGYYAQP